MKKSMKIERAATLGKSGSAVAPARVPRSRQSEVGNVDRDAVELLKLNSAGRVERLVPLAYGRILASPFVFFRGRDRHGKPLFLQFKEASQSVIARYRGKRKNGHEGQRIVEGQRLMQAASDPSVGWAKGPLGGHFSNRYADQVEQDYERFAAACRSGQLEARTHEDMAAGFRF